MDAGARDRQHRSRDQHVFRPGRKDGKASRSRSRSSGWSCALSSDPRRRVLERQPLGAGPVPARAAAVAVGSRFAPNSVKAAGPGRLPLRVAVIFISGDWKMAKKELYVERREEGD